MTIKQKEDLPDRRPEIDLTGPDGNAFVLIAYARRFAKEIYRHYPADGSDPIELWENFEEIREEMMSGDYEHLVETFEYYFGDYVDLLR